MSESSTTEKLVLCPYCGHAQYGGDRCQACAGLFEPLSRRATQLAMGPWQIRDKNQPFRPGCCYDQIKKLAKAGRVKSHTVLRGPTTRQFWSVARNVPGIAHLIGYCHECGNHVSPSDAKCGKCAAVFTEPRERNTLGLVYKNDEEVMFGQHALDAELRGEPVTSKPVPGPTKRTKPRAAKPGDLLAEVLDLSGDAATPAPPPAAAAPASQSASNPPPNAGPTYPPPSQQPQAGKPLDFVPTAQAKPTTAPMPTSAFDVAPTSEVPESDGGISTMGLVMIAANVIAIATIILLFVMKG